MTRSLIVQQADSNDIKIVAEIFTECFETSVRHYCGKLPKEKAMEDIFRFVYEAEPNGAFVAKLEGNVIGYCFAPVSLSGMWTKAIIRGYIFRWVWHYLSGQYGIGIYPLKIIAWNKLRFVRSALSPTVAADARILSIAVAKCYQRQGIAQRLMHEAMRYFSQVGAHKIRLEVRPDNPAAISVYKKYGFKEYGMTKDSQGDWLIMLKEMG